MAGPTTLWASSLFSFFRPGARRHKDTRTPHWPRSPLCGHRCKLSYHMWVQPGLGPCFLGRNLSGVINFCDTSLTGSRLRVPILPASSAPHFFLVCAISIAECAAMPLTLPGRRKPPLEPRELAPMSCAKNLRASRGFARLQPGEKIRSGVVIPRKSFTHDSCFLARLGVLVCPTHIGSF